MLQHSQCFLLRFLRQCLKLMAKHSGEPNHITTFALSLTQIHNFNDLIIRANACLFDRLITDSIHITSKKGNFIYLLFLKVESERKKKVTSTFIIIHCTASFVSSPLVHG